MKELEIRMEKCENREKKEFLQHGRFDQRGGKNSSRDETLSVNSSRWRIFTWGLKENQHHLDGNNPSQVSLSYKFTLLYRVNVYANHTILCVVSMSCDISA